MIELSFYERPTLRVRYKNWIYTAHLIHLMTIAAILGFITGALCI